MFHNRQEYARVASLLSWEAYLRCCDELDQECRDIRETYLEETGNSLSFDADLACSSCIRDFDDHMKQYFCDRSEQPTAIVWRRSHKQQGAYVFHFAMRYENDRYICCAPVDFTNNSLYGILSLELRSDLIRALKQYPEQGSLPL